MSFTNNNSKNRQKSEFPPFLPSTMILHTPRIFNNQLLMITVQTHVYQMTAARYKPEQVQIGKRARYVG